MQIRNNVKKELKARNMTQIELSNRTGIRPATINTIVKDNTASISYEYVEKIAEALGIHNLNDLYSLEDVDLMDYVLNNNLRKFKNPCLLNNLIDSFNIEIKYIEIYTSLSEMYDIKAKQIGNKEMKKDLKQDRDDILEKLEVSKRNIKHIKDEIIIRFKDEPNHKKLQEYYDRVSHSAFKLDLSIILKAHVNS